MSSISINTHHYLIAYVLLLKCRLFSCRLSPRLYPLFEALHNQLGCVVLHDNTGKLNENVAPLSSLLFSAHILPPCASTILFDMNNPKPVPPISDFEANFVNNFGSMSESIP